MALPQKYMALPQKHMALPQKKLEGESDMEISQRRRAVTGTTMEVFTGTERHKDGNIPHKRCEGSRKA